MLDKVIQFPRNYLFYILFYIHFNQTNNTVKGTNIFEHIYLYSAYSDRRSIKELINTFTKLSKCSGLTPNNEKCDIAGIEVLKSVKEAVAVFGMKCIYLFNDTIQITGIHFSYKEKKWNEKKISREHN